MNLKSRFVLPIRSRYVFATNHFEVEIVSGNEGSYFVSRYRGRGIPKKSEFFSFSFLKLSGHKKLQEKTSELSIVCIIWNWK